MDNLEYIAKQLVEMIRMAKEAKDGMLAYLLEMALAETHDEIRKRRSRQQA